MQTTVDYSNYVFSGFILQCWEGGLGFLPGFSLVSFFFGRGVPGTCSGQDWIGKGRIRWKENNVS